MNIEEEIQRYRVIPRDVKESVQRILLPAEFYMMERLRDNNGKRFDESFLLGRYAAVFNHAKECCRKNREMGITLGQEFTDADYDMRGFEKAREYLLYRMNGGNDGMFKRFAEFRPDIQLMLAAMFRPAEQYIEEGIREEGQAGEHMTMLSQAGPDRWREYAEIKFNVSLFAGWDAPEERKYPGGYDRVLEYAMKRLVLG